MALSDEDRAAIRIVRAMMAAVPVEDRLDTVGIAALERVLKLAGEEPKEPADRTFWFDEEECEVWIRDDRATINGRGDLRRWRATRSGGNFTWTEVCGFASKLVELVRIDAPGKNYQAVLMELHWAWEAWHRNACGKGKPLSECQYHECAHRWKVLLGYGFDKEWERG